MLLYIIRHGDPDYATDSLTPLGLLQAEAVGARLAKVGIDKVFSSSMGRAMQTAAPTCRLLGLECVPQDWARELQGEMITYYPNGKRKALGAVPAACFWEEGGEDLDRKTAFQSPPFRDADMEQALQRVEADANRFLLELGYQKEGPAYRILRNNEERVALFCHAGFARALCCALLKIPAHTMYASFSYGHTGVTILDFKNHSYGITAPRCLCYSDMSHLYAAGLDMKYNNETPI